MRWWLVALLMTSAQRVRAEESTIPSVGDKRWAAAMGYGVAVARARTDNPDAPVLIAVELAIRFRVLPVLEVAIAMDGAVAGQGRLGYFGLVGDVRYRLLAERPWDPFVFGGVGDATWSGAGVLLVHAGGGIERRFRRAGLLADLDLSRIGGNSSHALNRQDTQSELAHFGTWGATLKLSAAYYWGGHERPARRRFVP